MVWAAEVGYPAIVPGKEELCLGCFDTKMVMSLIHFCFDSGLLEEMP